MGKNSALVLRELYYTNVDSDEHLIKSVIPLNLFQKIFEYMYHHKNISDVSRQKSMLQCWQGKSEPLDRKLTLVDKKYYQ